MGGVSLADAYYGLNKNANDDKCRPMCTIADNFSGAIRYYLDNFLLKFKWVCVILASHSVTVRRMARSQRNIAVLLPRVIELFAAQHTQALGNPHPGVVRHDDVVDIAAVAGDKRVGEALPVFLGAGRDLVRIADVAAKDDFDRALRPHHRYFRRRPGEINVAAQVF